MPIEEIIVTGKRSSPPGTAPPPPSEGSTYFDTFVRDLNYLDDAEAAQERAIEEFEARQSFVAPVAALPQVITDILTAAPATIEEIIVTASRPALPIGMFGGLLAGAAVIGAEIARELSQQRLDESFRAFQNVQPRTPDSPVATIEPEVIDEIIVTARRPILRPGLLPTGFSFLSPDADPFEMETITPRFFPETPQIPEISPQFPEIFPEIPQPRPTISPQIAPPRPQILPEIRPEIGDAPDTFAFPLATPLPLPSPLPLPQPFPDVTPQPFAPPAPAPLTPVSPGLVGFPNPMQFAQPFAQTDPNFDTKTRKCKPPVKTKQKKKREKPRTKCFKKLVKEARFKKNDKSFNWVAIDCRTGKEI